MRSFQVCALVLAALALGASADPAVVLVDGPGGRFLKHGSSGGLTSAGLAATVSSLLGAKQPLTVGPAEASQVGAVLSEDAWAKPAAVSTVNVAGVDAESLSAASKEKLSGGCPHMHVAELSSATSSDAVLSALGAAASSVKTVGSVTPMELQNCDDACLEGFLKRAVEAFGGKYTPGETPLTGVIVFESEARLDLNNNADQLWAVEVATLYGAAEQAAASAGAIVSGSAQMFESTLMSMQGLAAEYGADSAQFVAAWDALASTIGACQMAMSKAFDGEMVHGVTLMGDAAAETSTIRHLLSWAADARRGLLQAGGETATVKDFTGMAVAIGVLIIILYFAAAGVFCLVNMDFTQDTLLYSGAKTD